jgi:hypothetical protein
MTSNFSRRADEVCYVEAVMSKKAYDKIAAGLKDALAIVRGEANRASYRVHVPLDVEASTGLADAGKGLVEK